MGAERKAQRDGAACGGILKGPQAPGGLGLYELCVISTGRDDLWMAMMKNGQ